MDGGVRPGASAPTAGGGMGEGAIVVVCWSGVGAGGGMPHAYPGGPRGRLVGPKKMVQPRNR
jgi:hypothetical protein